MIRTIAAALLIGSLVSCATTPQPLAHCGLDQPVPERLRNARTIMVGEMHGSEEMPAFVANLACSLMKEGKSVTLGLEIPRDTNDDLHAYLASDGGAEAVARLTRHVHWSRKLANQDGRASKAMLGLIDRARQWRAAGLPIDVEAFDMARDHVVAPEEGRALMAQRDRLMAERASTLVRPGRTLILLAGNVHAIKYVEDTPRKGDLMAALMDPPPDLSINLEYRGGTVWSCDRTGCGVHDPGAYYSDPALDGHIVLERKGGYDGAAYVGRVTASPPARQ